MFFHFFKKARAGASPPTSSEKKTERRVTKDVADWKSQKINELLQHIPVATCSSAAARAAASAARRFSSITRCCSARVRNMKGTFFGSTDFGLDRDLPTRALSNSFSARKSSISSRRETLLFTRTSGTSSAKRKNTEFRFLISSFQNTESKRILNAGGKKVSRTLPPTEPPL